MKLLVFSPYYPPHIGGLESHADEFNSHLSKRVGKITVFTPRLPENAPEKETRHDDVEIIRFPAFEIIPNYPLPKFWKAGFWKLFAGLLKNEFDVVISRTRFFNTSLWALFYAKMKKVRWVHIEHGSDFVKLNNPFNSLIAKIYDFTFGKMVLTLADKIIANSKASADFCRKLKKKDYLVVYRGVETERILNAKPAFDVKEGCPNEIIITFTGRLIDGKGVADLLQAIRMIDDKNIRCLIVGDGPQRKRLESISEKTGIGNKVIFLGRQSFERTIGILKISDIFVSPSYTEGLPTSVIEAALCKKAVIATDVGGTPEIFTDNHSGFFIKPKNIAMLTEKLNILIKDSSLRKNLGNNAYDEVINKFDWNKSIDKYMEIFKNLIY